MLKIKEIRERKKLTQDEMVEKTGINKRSYFNYESGTTDVPISKLQNIASVLEVTVSELINEPYITETLPQMAEESQSTYALRSDGIHEDQKIPLYDIHAAAGLIPMFENPNMNKTDEFIVIPRAPKCDGAIFVTGDSMYPLLKSGDIVAYKWVHDIPDDVFWGEMYLVSVISGDEEFVSVKYVHKGKNDDYIKLVSQNSHVEPKEVRLSKVRKMAMVKASIRINSMA